MSRPKGVTRGGDGGVAATTRPYDAIDFDSLVEEGRVHGDVFLRSEKTAGTEAGAGG